MSRRALLLGVAGAIAAAACGGDDVFVAPPDSGLDAPAARDASASDATPANDAVADAPVCLGNGDAAIDGAAAATGMALVAQLHCASCHQGTPPDAGITLSGRNTTLLDGGAVFPPNLTPDPATGLGCWTDSQITNAILNGIDDQNMALCVMPKFALKGIDGGSADEIVEYLRSLPAVVNPVPQTICPQPPPDGGVDAAPDSGADSAADAPDAGD